MENNPDYLRTPETVCNPDIRSPTTAFLTGKPLMVAYQYDRVSNNHYAHGSTSLHDHALGTIRLVAEIINQIF